jgi:hypothetical protein
VTEKDKDANIFFFGLESNLERKVSGIIIEFGSPMTSSVLSAAVSSW